MKPTKILTVEDNELFALILQYNIEDELNCEFMNVSSGEECLERLDWLPDLVLLDYALPGFDGLETLKRIKRLKPDLQVIVVSSQSNVQVAVDFIQAGASHYIEKDNNPVYKLIDFIRTIRTTNKI